MRDLMKRVWRLEEANTTGLHRFEFWATDGAWSTSMETGEVIPSEELEARSTPPRVRRIEFVRADKTLETTP